MNKCIYYKEDNLKYDTREHIFPAGIGGTKRLPKGYVSNKANSYFSNIERVAIRETFIGGIRNYIGPGHRGKRVTISDKGIIQCSAEYRPHIQILRKKGGNNEHSFKLGFMYNKHTMFLPQIFYSVDNRLKLTERIYSPGGYDNPQNKPAYFFECMKELAYGKAEIVKTEFAVAANTILLGCFYNKWYYYCNVPFIEFVDVIRICEDQVCDDDLIIDLSVGGAYDFSYKMEGGIVGGELQFICCKTAFNTLADIMGQEFVLDNRFDKTRNIIIGSDKETILHTCDPCKATRWISALDAKDPHVVIFETINEKLFAVVTFYGELSYVFVMAECIKENISCAYVCDWRKRNEYVVKGLELCSY